MVTTEVGWESTEKNKLANKVNIKSVTEFNKISNQKIKEKLNYEFISVEESLALHTAECERGFNIMSNIENSS